MCVIFILIVKFNFLFIILDQTQLVQKISPQFPVTTPSSTTAHQVTFTTLVDIVHNMTAHLVGTHVRHNHETIIEAIYSFQFTLKISTLDTQRPARNPDEVQSNPTVNQFDLFNRFGEEDENDQTAPSVQAPVRTFILNIRKRITSFLSLI